MPKMTEKQAIAECKELWEAIEKSGLSKDAFLNTEEGKTYMDRNYTGSCPLCEYTNITDPENHCSCRTCLLVVKYGKKCGELGFDIRSGVATKEFFTAVRGL